MLLKNKVFKITVKGIYNLNEIVKSRELTLSEIVTLANEKDLTNEEIGEIETSIEPLAPITYEYSIKTVLASQKLQEIFKDKYVVEIFITEKAFGSVSKKALSTGLKFVVYHTFDFENLIHEALFMGNNLIKFTDEITVFDNNPLYNAFEIDESYPF